MGEEIVCGYKLLRELGARALPAYAAIDPKPRRPEDALCVVERLARGGGLTAESAAEFLRDAKRLSQFRHPNLAQVRDVVLGTNTMLLVIGWVDGEVLSDVQRMAAAQGIPIPLAGGLRIVVDLLEGLSALHEVRDAKREPLHIVHAEVAPPNIVVGVDGRAVLVHPLRPPTGPTRDHAPDVVGYLAPEVLLGDQTADQRADVYGAGVLLWEALTGRRMHAEGEDSGEIVMRLLGGRIEAPSAPGDAPWAAPLAEAAKRAVSPDPSVRFPNATAMLAEVRRAVGARLAPKLAMAALVEAVAGDHIRKRVAALGVTRAPRLASGSAWTNEPPTGGSPREAQLGLHERPAPRAARQALESEPGFDEDATKVVSRPTASVDRAALRADAPSPHAAPARPSEPPMSADVLEVVEMDVPPRAPEPQPPPLPRRERPPAAPHAAPSALRLETPTTLSRTDSRSTPGTTSAPATPARKATWSTSEDVAALVASARGAGGTRARWTILLACALGAAAVLWLLFRGAGQTRTDSSDAPAPSVAATAADPPRAPLASATPTPSASPTGNDPRPFDPAGDDHGRASPLPPGSPPLPTVKGASPTPPAPPSPATPAQPAAPTPATSSTRPKKPVYDPMGI